MPTLRRRAIKLTAVSSPGQAGPDEASLPTQSALLDALAQQRNVEIIDHIEIPGFSRDFYSWHEFTMAAKEKRIDAGERMLAHWAARDFDEVLVYDGTRFARKESIFLEFYLRTRDIGATIVRHLGGEMTMTDIGPVMFEAYASGREMQTRKARLKMGRDKRFADGKHYADVPMTHIELYDEKHNALGVYRLNPLFDPIWPDVLALVLEGVAWAYLERELLARYGHVNPITGRPFIRLTFYRLLTQMPMTWGILAQWHSYAKRREFETRQTFVHHWMYDTRVPLPPDLKIKRDACPAVTDLFTPAQTAALIAELCDRRDAKGSTAAAQTYPFTGLCVCDTCGMSMKVKQAWGNQAKTYKHYYMACNYSQHDCTNQKSVRFEVIQAYIQAILVSLITSRAWPDTDMAPDSTAQQTAALRQEAQRIDEQMDTLVTELSGDLPLRAKEKIRQRLQILSDRLEAIKEDQGRLDAQRIRHARRQSVLEDSAVYLETITLPGLWALPAHEVNQFLKRLFDGRRIVIRGRDIVGIR